MDFYDSNTAPDVFDVVWCMWPRREDKLAPGPWVRCVLVLDMLDTKTTTEYALVTAAYGTGAENVNADDLKHGLYITVKNIRRSAFTSLRCSGWTWKIASDLRGAPNISCHLNM